MAGIEDFFESPQSMEEFVKVALIGESGTGKTSSIVYGCPKPLLVFDLERGCSQYSKVAPDFKIFRNSKVKGFDETDPQNILRFAKQLLKMQKSGKPIPFKSILLDSATILYDRILNDTLKSMQGTNEEKVRLEPNEYAIPKALFYEIIRTLKQLDVHLFITCQASTNYLKNAFMKVNTLDPIKANCEKGFAHEMDVVMILEKLGDTYKATTKKSRLVDSEGNSLIAPVINNFSNFDLVPMVIEMANKDKGYVDPSDNSPKNQVETNKKFSQMITNVKELVGGLSMTETELKMLVSQATKKRTTLLEEMSIQEIDYLYIHLRKKIEAEGGEGK